VDAARLSRHPDERGHRVAPERIGGEQMTPVRIRGGFALHGRKQRGVGDRVGERRADGLRKGSPMRRFIGIGGFVERAVERLAQAVHGGMGGGYARRRRKQVADGRSAGSRAVEEDQIGRLVHGSARKLHSLLIGNVIYTGLHGERVSI